MKHYVIYQNDPVGGESGQQDYAMGSLFIRLIAVVILAFFVSSCSTADRTMAISRPSDHLLHQGKVHFRNRDYGLAEKYFRYAIEENDTSVDAWLGLAASYDHLRRFDLAERSYKVIIEQVGYTPTVLNNLGYHHMLRGNLREARGYLERAEQISPDNPHVQSNLKLLETWPTSHGARPRRF